MKAITLLLLLMVAFAVQSDSEPEVEVKPVPDKKVMSKAEHETYMQQNVTPLRYPFVYLLNDNGTILATETDISRIVVLANLGKEAAATKVVGGGSGVPLVLESAANQPFSPMTITNKMGPHLVEQAAINPPFNPMTIAPSAASPDSFY